MPAGKEKRCFGRKKIKINKKIRKNNIDVHGSTHYNTNLIEMTKKMQLCRTIYYSIVS
jgi:hypothetical protein